MDNGKELAIAELLLMKNRLPEQRKNMYVAMNLYKKQMTIDDIIKEIKEETRFGNNFVKSNLIRLKQYPQRQKYIPPQKIEEETQEENQDQQKE